MLVKEVKDNFFVLLVLFGVTISLQLRFFNIMKNKEKLGFLFFSFVD